MRLAEARTSKVRRRRVWVAVLTARCQAPPLRRRLSTCAGTGARKYLRRGPYYAGDVSSVMVGCRGTGRFAHEQPRDSQGQWFVVGRARRKSRCEEQPSARQCRTLQRWRRAKAPRTWARGAGVRAATRRVANSCCPWPWKWPFFSCKFTTFVKTTLQALRTALRRCDSRTRLDELYRNLRGHFSVRPTVRRGGAKD